MKISTIALVPVLAFGAAAQATTDFTRVYAGTQFISSAVGFRLGGEYVLNEKFLLSADYQLYNYNENLFGNEYDYSYSATRLEGGILFPIDQSQSPIPELTNISAYAVGGLAILSASAKYSGFSSSASSNTISLRGGLRADITETIWADVNLGFLSSGGGLTLGSEVGYQINESFDVSAFFGSGVFNDGGIGLLGSYKF